jgi:hypothetical protein
MTQQSVLRENSDGSASYIIIFLMKRLSLEKCRIGTNKQKDNLKGDKQEKYKVNVF